VWRRRCRGQLVPGPPVEQAPACLRRPTTPLLMEERDPGRLAPIAQVEHSVGIAWTVPWSALAMGDDPVEVVDLERRQRAEQRLGVHQSDCRWYIARVGVRTAVGQFGPEGGLALFERDGAAAVLRRLQAAALVAWVEDADYGTPLLSLDELIIQTRAVIRLLEDEREHLLRHGLRPTRNFTDFPAELLVNLYPIRPHWLTTWSKGAGLMAPGDEIQPGHGQVAEAAGVVLAPERPVVWMDEWDPPDWLPIAGSAATPDPEGQQQIDAYYEARWCAWLEPSEAVQLQAGRAKLGFVHLGRYMESARGRRLSGGRVCDGTCFTSAFAADMKKYQRDDTPPLDASSRDVAPFGAKWTKSS